MHTWNRTCNINAVLLGNGKHDWNDLEEEWFIQIIMNALNYGLHVLSAAAISTKCSSIAAYLFILLCR